MDNRKWKMGKVFVLYSFGPGFFHNSIINYFLRQGRK